MPAELSAHSEQSHLELTLVPQEAVLSVLGLTDTVISSSIRESVYKSQWFSVDNGRIVVEVRKQNKFALPNTVTEKTEQLPKIHIGEHGIVYVVDFDDTTFSATEMHNSEFKAISESESLQKRNIRLTEEEAKRFYDLSKMVIPGTAVKESRYTPRLNMLLLTEYAKKIQQGKTKEQAFEETLLYRDTIETDSKNGISNWTKRPLDQEIVDIFRNNSLTGFLCTEFIDDIFRGSEREDIRVIATRGTIEGFLGQVHKVHASGLMGLSESAEGSDGVEGAQGVDMVIYTNDLKVESLGVIAQCVTDLQKRLVRIYDDNLHEIEEFYKWAYQKEFTNIELFRVRHFGSKRRDYTTTLPKVLSTPTQRRKRDTVCELYIPRSVEHPIYIGSNIRKKPID